MTGDAVNCPLTDFMPEHLIALADRRGLITMMHLSKRDAIADPENVRDMLRLTKNTPTPTGYWPTAPQLLGLGHRESGEAVARPAQCLVRHLLGVRVRRDGRALFRRRRDRVMYGSDDVPVGVLRGKYIAFGYAWAYLSETNHGLNLTHCEPRMTFTR